MATSREVNRLNKRMAAYRTTDDYMKKLLQTIENKLIKFLTKIENSMIQYRMKKESERKLINYLITRKVLKRVS